MKNLILFLLLLFALSACSVFSTKIAPEIAKGVDKYCEEASQAIRAETEKLINLTTKPGNTVSITCSGDARPK